MLEMCRLLTFIKRSYLYVFYILMLLMPLYSFAVTLNDFISDFNEKTENDLNNQFSDSERILSISSKFLGIPYVSNRLIGSIDNKEQLVFDLNQLDCFTYIDYVEALKRAKNIDDVLIQLVQIRYKQGDINFTSRRHFFSDWISGLNPIADDITQSLSIHSVTVVKVLNQKQKENYYIDGLTPVERVITYIPSRYVDKNVISQLKTGDYIGIYSPKKGLDVTHSGIFIRLKNNQLLRNASSKKTERKVIDSDFVQYIRNKPGIIVYRSTYKVD